MTLTEEMEALREKVRANLRKLEEQGEIYAIKLDVTDRITTVKADCRCGAKDVILWREFTMTRFKTVYDARYGSRQEADGYYIQIQDVLEAVRTGVTTRWPENRCGVCKTREDLVERDDHDSFDPVTRAGRRSFR